ncbi:MULTISPECIES: hypothetical protein [Deinococcus]|jgi:hypothetical protein|uniref:Uncharacterized protein n=5 Tax=Deinococcus TaxID=1298 RepID=A0AAE3XA86_9DEIO|nr:MULTISPECIES: hypothetical protein [Deinococcus]MDK2011635.1 hypothetical protein [Deinococcus sp. 43]MDR6217184.1 hypothetical protein [Deinococcus soli (ex Cha et al. 2016)]MDR6326493.1 hypothetical protein [Deinococcus soli (ex Cha et al. 2016)]MDR6750780.1 hypothetical protein [Deinococcus soli (ex Cha et al. 2016)]BBN94671.1 hypothetical protein DEGR_14040 [Deinococcus grandis]
MALWLVFGFILLSATLILAMTFGPLRAAANVRVIRMIAYVQYAAALLLLGARLTGKA